MEFQEKINRLSDILNNGGTQTEFNRAVKQLSGFDIRFIYSLVNTTEKEEHLEKRLKKILTQQYLKRLNKNIDDLTVKEKELLDKQLSKVSAVKRKRKIAYHFVRNSKVLNPENNLNAYYKKVYNIVDIKYEHNYLSEAGIPLISLYSGKTGDYLWNKKWFPPYVNVDRKQQRLKLLLEREERAREQFKELVELYGKRIAMAIISRGRKTESRKKPVKTMDCATCDFQFTRVCRYCPRFLGR